MDDIYQVRRKNAQLLVDFIGNKTLFAEEIERSSTQVSRLMGVNPTRNIGEKLARHIEHSFCLPKFWLDNPHDSADEINPNLHNINQDKYEHLHEILCELYQATITRQVDESTYLLMLDVIENHRSL
ncbi:MAG: hypothetical protein ACP5D0_04150 [Hydrogenovibrio sp.]